MPEPMPVIVAHRGLYAQHPENSLAAFLAAWNAGIAWCECDVHLSADGVPIVIHDDTLEGTTTGRGRVSVHSASELTKMFLLAGDGRITEETVPLLDDLISRIPDGCNLLVETKPLLGQRIVQLARKLCGKPVMLQSFYGEDMERLDRALGQKVPCAVLSETIFGMRSGIACIHVNYKDLDELLMQTCREEKMRVGVWTVNDPAQIRRVAALGVDMIITDNPLEAQRIIAELPRS